MKLYRNSASSRLRPKRGIADFPCKKTNFSISRNLVYHFDSISIVVAEKNLEISVFFFFLRDLPLLLILYLLLLKWRSLGRICQKNYGKQYLIASNPRNTTTWNRSLSSASACNSSPIALSPPSTSPPGRSSLPLITETSPLYSADSTTSNESTSLLLSARSVTKTSSERFLDQISGLQL